MRERSKPAGSMSPGMMARGPSIDLGHRCAPERGEARSLLVPLRLGSARHRATLRKRSKIESIESVNLLAICFSYSFFSVVYYFVLIYLFY